MTNAKYYSGDKFIKQGFWLDHTLIYNTSFPVFIYNSPGVRYYMTFTDDIALLNNPRIKETVNPSHFNN
jgi:hypothetical protein